MATRTKERTSAPAALAAKSLRQGRAMTGEEVGLMTDDREKTVTFSVYTDAPLDVATAQTVLPALGTLDGVMFVQATFSPALGDCIAVTMGDTTRAKKIDIADVVATAEVTIPTALDVLADHGVAVSLGDVEAVATRAAAAWAGTPAGNFPPQGEWSAGERTATIGPRTVVAFEVTVDATLAVDAVVDTMDTLASTCAVHLVYRPGLNAAAGRFAAALVVYGENTAVAEDIAGFIIATAAPLVRLRLRRQLWHHHTMTALGCCAGVAPWNFLDLKETDTRAR